MVKDRIAGSVNNVNQWLRFSSGRTGVQGGRRGDRRRSARMHRRAAMRHTELRQGPRPGGLVAPGAGVLHISLAPGR